MGRASAVRPGLVRGALGAILPLVACIDPDPYPYPYDYVGPDIAELTIDAGEALILDPGEGVGVAVEYAGDGFWSVTTACDTLLSDAICLFDVLVSSDGSEAGLSDLAGVGLESNDDVWAPDPFAAQLDFLTETAEDGATFSTSPGATVRVSVLLYDPVFDWSDDPRVISWVGNGAIHWGAPTNPVDLTPNRP
jgi:hypothetical protein